MTVPTLSVGLPPALQGILGILVLSLSSYSAFSVFRSPSAFLRKKENRKKVNLFLRKDWSADQVVCGSKRGWGGGWGAGGG